MYVIVLQKIQHDHITLQEREKNVKDRVDSVLHTGLLDEKSTSLLQSKNKDMDAAVLKQFDDLKEKEKKYVLLVVKLSSAELSPSNLVAHHRLVIRKRCMLHFTPKITVCSTLIILKVWTLYL